MDQVFEAFPQAARDAPTCSGSEAGSYLRLIDSCATQLKTQGLSRTCNESKEEEASGTACPTRLVDRHLGGVPREQKMLKGHLPRVIYHMASGTACPTRSPLTPKTVELITRGGLVLHSVLTPDCLTRLVH